MEFPWTPASRRWTYGMCLSLVAALVAAGGPAARTAAVGDGDGVAGGAAELPVSAPLADADESPANYVPFPTPVGALYTWDGTGGVTGARGPNSITTFPVLGVGGVPATGVSAVLVRVSTSGPTEPTFLELWPDGASRPPDVSTLNVVAGGNVSGVAVVAPGENGRIAVYNRSGETEIGVDVQGYFGTAAGLSTGRVRAGHANPADRHP